MSTGALTLLVTVDREYTATIWPDKPGDIGACRALAPEIRQAAEIITRIDPEPRQTVLRHGALTAKGRG